MPGFLGGAAKGLYAYAVRQEDEDRKMREKEADRAYQRSENDRIYDRNRSDNLQDKQDEAASNPENYTINGDVAEGVIYVRGEPVKFTAPKGSAVYNRALLAKESDEIKLKTDKARLTQEEFDANEGLRMKRERHASEMENDRVTRTAALRRGDKDSEVNPYEVAQHLAKELGTGKVHSYEVVDGRDADGKPIKFNDLFGKAIQTFKPALPSGMGKWNLQILGARAAAKDPQAIAALDAIAPFIRIKKKGETQEPPPDLGGNSNTQSTTNQAAETD
jgi:hypothetical protein